MCYILLMAEDLGKDIKTGFKFDIEMVYQFLKFSNMYILEKN